MTRRQRPRHARPDERLGAQPRHARPTWARIHLAARIQHLDVTPGRTSAEAEAAPRRQPHEPHRPRLADLEIEP